MGNLFQNRQKKQLYKRKQLGKKFRREVWDQYNKNSLKGECYSCYDIIDYDNFECGHVIPVSKGGSNQLSNLKPICRPCNQQMATMNLETFKNQLDKFKK